MDPWDLHRLSWGNHLRTRRECKIRAYKSVSWRDHDERRGYRDQALHYSRLMREHGVPRHDA